MPKLRLRWNGKRTVKNLLLVIVGTLILSFATAVFLVPFRLITGGISGISLVLDAIIPWDVVTTDLPVMQILETHGFTNYKLFSRMFRNIYGGTPREVRRRNRERSL